MASRDTGVYVIEQIRTGRRYIGSAVSLKHRWREHVRQLTTGKHHSRFLQRCWNKEGATGFRFSVALYCDRENLLMYEQALLDFYRPAFNSAPTAGSQLGLKMGPEARAKMAAAARRTRNFTGCRHSDETKARISATKTGRQYGTYDAARVRRAAEAMRVSKNAMTEAEVRFIRLLRRERKLPHREVAQWVGRSYTAIADLARNRTYKWVK